MQMDRVDDALLPRAVIDRLAEFSQLKADWDSYGAEPIASFAIEVAKSVVWWCASRVARIRR